MRYKNPNLVQSILLKSLKTTTTSQETLILTIAASKPNYSKDKNPITLKKYPLESLNNFLQDRKNLIKIHLVYPKLCPDQSGLKAHLNIPQDPFIPKAPVLPSPSNIFYRRWYVIQWLTFKFSEWSDPCAEALHQSALSSWMLLPRARLFKPFHFCHPLTQRNYQ